MSGKTENITVPQGDYGYYLNFTLKDSEGNIRDDMEDYTAKLKVWRAGKSTELLVDGDCGEITAGGICPYEVQEGDFDIVGRYVYEIEATITVDEEVTIRESAQNGFITVIESPYAEPEEEE